MRTATAITLPTGLDECHALIAELNSTLLEEQRRTTQLQQRLDVLLKRFFGPRAERMDPGQLVMFGQEANAEPQPEALIEEEAPAQAAAKKKGHGRKPLPEDLPRTRVVHDVADAEKSCACGAHKTRIGEDVREQLEFVPASFFVLEHVYPKYACAQCQEGVSQANAAPRVIEKGLPGPGLVAHVITSKYSDHLPLYRQERIFARHGVELARTTLCGWALKAADTLAPLAALMRREVLASRVIHTDDTPVRVQGDGEGAFTGRLWVYAGDADHPYTVYDYTPSRRREGPANVLDGYEGYLQADAFGGYDGIYAAGNVIECACWAHARRKFHDAIKSDSNRAHRALAWIRQLYAVEREAKTLDAEARRALRIEQSKPVLDAIAAWLGEQHSNVLPKSPIATAIGYALNHWTALTRYLDDGIIAIDNNTAEQALRAIAVGRKNWLFLGSENGGRAAAIHYTLIQTAKRHGLDPYAYLRHALLQLATQPNTDLRELLPTALRPASPA